MNVLVTGSHGYIGSVLCKTLTEEGHIVVAVDNKPYLGHDFRYLEAVYNQSFDDDHIIDVILNNKIETIFHLAASSLLGPSAIDPMEYYWNNASKTVNFLHKLIKANWKGHIIFSSTAAVYGAQDHAVSEFAPLQPCNHYGQSKLDCEHALQTAFIYGIKTTMFRYFNVAGAYDDKGQGFGEPHILTRICNAAADVEELVVYGNDYPTRDGSCVRDYVHVRDVCRAQIHAMYNKNGMGCEAYNLGTNIGTTVLELIESFKRQTGIHVPYKIARQRREGDPAFLVANPNKFIDTGFTYLHSTTDEIVSSAWKYFNGVNHGV